MWLQKKKKCEKVYLIVKKPYFSKFEKKIWKNKILWYFYTFANKFAQVSKDLFNK